MVLTRRSLRLCGGCNWQFEWSRTHVGNHQEALGCVSNDDDGHNDTPCLHPSGLRNPKGLCEPLDLRHLRPHARHVSCAPRRRCWASRSHRAHLPTHPRAYPRAGSPSRGVPAVLGHGVADHQAGDQAHAQNRRDGLPVSHLPVSSGYTSRGSTRTPPSLFTINRHSDLRTIPRS